MIFLSKLLPLLFYPLGLAIELVGAAIICIYKNKKNAAYVLLGFSVFILLFFSSQAVGFGLVKILERQYMPVDPAKVKADAIVILSGATRPKMYPRRYVEFNEASERILESVRLYKAGSAPVVVASGGGIDFMLKGQREGDDMREAMIELGIPADAIINENESRNTHENAVCVKKLMDEKKLRKKILLVTSAFHMPRSVSIFRKEGFDVIPAPADYLVEDSEYSWYYFMPRPENLIYSTIAIKEFIGMAVYRAMGWM
ncbi:MAG: YdcF family protein [Candidatus Schekmanbacteria bacterium]|nr:YdcF family protein [Candidatus Schekmanbacteria bacterium]